LHVVNGLPSSIYSTTNTSLNLSPALALAQGHGHGSGYLGSSLTPGLRDAETPTLMAKSGYFDRIPSSLSFKHAGTPISPMLPNPYGDGSPTPTPPAVTKPLQIKKKHPGVGSPSKVKGELLAIQQELQDMDIAKGTGEASNEEKHKDTKVEKGKGKERAIKIEEQSPSSLPTSRTTNILATPPKRKPVPSSSPLPALPFRIIKPSLPTLEKATSVALFFEAFYTTLLRPPPSSNNYLLNRAKRLAALEESFNLLENRFMSEAERQFRRDELVKEENRMLRDKRGRVDARSFEMGRVIGHGAFGVVRIAREKEGGRLVAMKQVRRLSSGQLWSIPLSTQFGGGCQLTNSYGKPSMSLD